MKLSPVVVALALLLLLPGRIRAQSPAGGSVSGAVSEASTREPLENVNVMLRSTADSTHVIGATSGRDGRFVFTQVPPGTYRVECSLIGHTSSRSPQFVVGPGNPLVRLGAMSLKTSALVLDEVVIRSERSLFNHNIDRRVYNVASDLMAKSSTASDILQNIPSVQVDIDGNISLRGSSDVMILVNGRKSSLMGKSRADVLQQLPAASIEKIEVITNPSARFTPEGTSGIINLVMKKDAGAGVNGDLTGHLGEAGRHNESVSLGYNPGRLTLFANYSYRDDRRMRSGSDTRTPAGAGPTPAYLENNRVTMLPHVHMGNAGLSWRANPKNTLELSADHYRRRPVRSGLGTIVVRGTDGSVLTDFDRRLSGDESESESGVTASYQHDFAKEEHNLRIEAGASDSPEDEASRFVEHYRTPVRPDPANDILLRQRDRQGHFSLDYSNPVNDDSKLEAGYALELQRQDIRSDADTLDVAQGVFLPDGNLTYRFRLDQAIHAFYGTYERSLGKFSALGGLRVEYARVVPDLLSRAERIENTYSGLYPTLHLAFQASERGQVQLNYSRRIRRPESDDLNPFPEHSDRYNAEAGNPLLRPESIHSIELGYRLRGDHFSFVPSVYFRDKRDEFTRLTTAVGDTAFLRTMANLASDQSAGFEPVVTLSVDRLLQANLNGNVFYERIDASNIGYAGRKSVVSWSGTFNVNVTPRRTTVLEATATYRSVRLTPQGSSRPSFVLNMGAKQDFANERFSLTFAVSDLLRTQRQDTRLDVAGTQQHVTNRRDSRIFYAGLTYHYGRQEKDPKKDKAIQYEDQP